MIPELPRLLAIAYVSSCYFSVSVKVRTERPTCVEVSTLEPHWEGQLRLLPGTIERP